MCQRCQLSRIDSALKGELKFSGSGIPIIILAPESEVTDRILALNLGADDYITEPVNPMEFAVRVRACIRRFTGGIHFASESAGTAEKEDSLTIGRLTLDTKTLTLYKDETEISLTPIEYKLLCVLARNCGKVLTHKYITQQVWGTSWESNVASLRVFMATLRKKLESSSGAQVYIQTHVGIGYRMVKVNE